MCVTLEEPGEFLVTLIHNEIQTADVCKLSQSIANMHVVVHAVQMENSMVPNSMVLTHPAASIVYVPVPHSNSPPPHCLDRSEGVVQSQQANPVTELKCNNSVVIDHWRNLNPSISKYHSISKAPITVAS